MLPDAPVVDEQGASVRLTLERQVDFLQQKQAKLARELRSLAQDEMKLKLQLHMLVD